MGQFNNLIVRGASRLLSTLYCKDILANGTFTLSGGLILNGTLSGTIVANCEITGIITLGSDLLFRDITSAVRGIRGTVGGNDYWRLVGGATASNAGYLEIATADDGDEPIYVRQYSGVFSSIKRTLTLLDGAGNSSFPGIINASYLQSSYASGSYLSGNRGSSLVSSTASVGAYVTMLRYPSTGGVFTLNGYQGTFIVGYTAKATIDAGTNSLTKTLTLLNESGNSVFPGTITAPTFIGGLSGNATTATTATTASKVTSALSITTRGNSISYNGSSAQSVNVMTTYDVSVPISGWAADSANGGVKLTMNVAGITDKDAPIVSLIASTNVATAKLQNKAFGLIHKITTANGSITLYAKSTPATAITLKFVCM